MQVDNTTTHTTDLPKDINIDQSTPMIIDNEASKTLEFEAVAPAVFQAIIVTTNKYVFQRCLCNYAVTNTYFVCHNVAFSQDDEVDRSTAEM
jgi:hypothetical protein